MKALMAGTAALTQSMKSGFETLTVATKENSKKPDDLTESIKPI